MISLEERSLAERVKKLALVRERPKQPLEKQHDELPKTLVLESNTNKKLRKLCLVGICIY